MRHESWSTSCAIIPPARLGRVLLERQRGPTNQPPHRQTDTNTADAWMGLRPICNQARCHFLCSRGGESLQGFTSAPKCCAVGTSLPSVRRREEVLNECREPLKALFYG